MTIAPSSKFNRLSPLVSDLHPIMRGPITRLTEAAMAFTFPINGGMGQFQPFEGYRTAERQHYLLTVEKTTKAGPWQSAHQYGLAVDYAIRIREENSFRWSWIEGDHWDQLADLASAVQLRIPIRWDRGHVEHPIFSDIKHMF